MPWLHFYEEKKISQKIEIVLFMLGLAHVTTGFTARGPALLRHKTRTVMKNSWRARALCFQFIQGHRRHIELGDNAFGLGTTLAVVLLAIKVKKTKIHSFGVKIRQAQHALEEMRSQILEKL